MEVSDVHVKENYLLKEQLYIATAESSPTCVVHD